MSVYYSRIFSGSEAKKLVEVQGIFISVINGVEYVPQRIKNKQTSMLKSLWSSSEKIASYAQIFKLLDPSWTNLALGSTFLSYQVDLKSCLLEHLVKLIISNKIKTPKFVLTNLQPLLKTVTHEEFKTILLPPILKAMLRNPEMVLHSIGVILSKVPIDLSQYVTELGTYSFFLEIYLKYHI